jgi:hypothetical protein
MEQISHDCKCSNKQVTLQNENPLIFLKKSRLVCKWGRERERERQRERQRDRDRERQREGEEK